MRWMNFPVLFGTVCVVSLAAVNRVEAAVVSGEIKSLNAPRGSLAVYIPTTRRTLDFTVGSTTTITIDGAPAELADLKAGQRVSVFTTTGTRATKLVVRTGAPPAKPAPTKPKEPDPEPAPSRETPSAASSAAADRGGAAPWPGILGPARNGHSPEEGLNFNWGNNGPQPLWSQAGLGEGYSSVAVADGKVLTLGTNGNRESLFAMELATGKPLWAVPLGNIFQDGTGNGPRGTPTVDGDRVYALGGHGDLVCADLRSGRVAWSKNILNEFRARNITWGISESVLIDGDKLICTPGGDGAAMVALDKSNGQLIWKSAAPGNPQAAYASAIAIDVDGVRQYVNFTHSKVIGVRAEDGEFLWEDSSSCNGTANCSTPLYENGFLFYSSGYSTGGTLLELESSENKTTARQVYKTREMQSHHGGMVIVDGHIYGSSEGIFRCIELATGNVKWETRDASKGSVTFADGHLIHRSEQGPITLIAASPDAYQQKARFTQPPQLRSQRQAWAYPVVADGKLFIRDQQNLLCYSLR